MPMSTSRHNTATNLRLAILLFLLGFTSGFTSTKTGGVASLKRVVQKPLKSSSAESSGVADSVGSIDDATRILQEWDRYQTASKVDTGSGEMEESRSVLPGAVQILNRAAASERFEDSVKGQCMLGICASSGPEGLATLKSWVTALELPRGLLHGMDKDGVPIDMQEAVYIKYNSGGALTFADIRRSGIGFDALWKPGDAMLESYDGDYRGVYYQVVLSDGVFRQFLLPLNTFDT